MSPFKIKSYILLTTIEKMPTEFFTKDVSSHPDMINAHPEEHNHSHYHSFVGKAIKRVSNNQLKGKLLEVRKGMTKGSLWRKESLPKIEVVNIKNNLPRKIINKSSTSRLKELFKAGFSLLMVFGIIIETLFWIGFFIFSIVISFFGFFIRVFLKESNKKYD